MRRKIRLSLTRTTGSSPHINTIAGPSILATPAVVFCGVWGMTLGLISLQMTTQLVPMAPAALWMIGGNMAFIILLAVILHRVVPRHTQPISPADLFLLDQFISKLRLIWIVGSLFEIVASGGLPLQWALMENVAGRNYTDFGIPSFHGIMNALYLQMMSAYFLAWQLQGEKTQRNLFFLFLLWPIMMLGRGIFLSVVIQCLGILLLIRVVNARTITIVTLIALANIVLFGIIGNVRGTSNPFDYLVDEKWRWFFKAVPAGFLWVYIYVTSGLNNIFFNADNLEPLWQFQNTFSKLIPSFIWNIMGMARQADNLTFADANLNVSTMYAGIVSDFGTFGGFIFGCIILFFSSLVFVYTKKHLIWAMLAYCVVFQGLVFSVFYDMFLLLPTIMQLVIAAAFGIYHRDQRIKLARREAKVVRPILDVPAE